MLTQEIIDALKQSERSYYRMVLVVGESGAGKTQILQSIAEQTKTTVTNLNLELSKALLELSPKEQMLAAAEAFDEILMSTKTPKIIDNIEILFDEKLKINPLELLKNRSRNHEMIVSWNGSYQKGRLTYAEIGHHEYKSYNQPEVLIQTVGLK